MKRILKSPRFLKIAGFLIFCYAKLAFVTCKWKFDGIDKIYEAWDKEENIIVISWHGRVTLVPFLKKKNYKIDALVSLHHDGMLMANYLKHCDFGVIGGSSNRKPYEAALKLMGNIKKNQASIGIIPDGPQGPNMTMTPSPVYFAKKSGKPIFAVVYSMKNARIVKKAWDQMLIPPLFSTGTFKALGPYYVPSDITKEDMEQYAKKIENDMNKALLNIDKEYGLPKVEIGKVSRKKLKKQKKEN